MAGALSWGLSGSRPSVSFDLGGRYPAFGASWTCFESKLSESERSLATPEERARSADLRRITLETVGKGRDAAMIEVAALRPALEQLHARDRELA
jgi:hypothetical protein